MSIHISARPGEIAKLVLLPGDPLRARHIADHFLEKALPVSITRNNYFFTGTYQDKQVSVGASGMGCPSMGLYSYELFTEYDVDCIVRIGTCGAYSKSLKLYDIINVESACSESAYASFAFGLKKNRIKHPGEVFERINETATDLHMNIENGAVHSTDVFYRKVKGKAGFIKKYKCCAVEMESFALFANARYLGKKAASLLTVSDILRTHERLSAEEREKALEPMIRLALESLMKI